MAKWIAAEKAKAGLLHAVVGMPERDGKDQGEDIPKQRARAGSLALVDYSHTSGANLYPTGVWFECFHDDSPPPCQRRFQNRFHVFSPSFFFLLVQLVYVNVIVNASLSCIFFNLAA